MVVLRKLTRILNHERSKQELGASKKHPSVQAPTSREAPTSNFEVGSRRTEMEKVGRKKAQSRRTEDRGRAEKRRARSDDALLGKSWERKVDDTSPQPLSPNEAERGSPGRSPCHFLSPFGTFCHFLSPYFEKGENGQKVTWPAWMAKAAPCKQRWDKRTMERGKGLTSYIGFLMGHASFIVLYRPFCQLFQISRFLA